MFSKNTRGSIPFAQFCNYRKQCTRHDRWKWKNSRVFFFFFFFLKDRIEATGVEVIPTFYPKRVCDLLIENINQFFSLFLDNSRYQPSYKTYKKILKCLFFFRYQPSCSPTYSWETMGVPVLARYLHQCLCYSWYTKKKSGICPSLYVSIIVYINTTYMVWI